MSTPIVLLVDDDPRAGALVTGELGGESLYTEVRQVADAAALTVALERGGFDLVIADPASPCAAGLAVLRAVKARRPEYPVIFFTAGGSTEAAVEAMKAGVDDYVFKPPAPSERLAGAVRAALALAQQRRATMETEAPLRWEHHLLQVLMDSLPELIYFKDAQSRFTRVNRALVTWLGEDGPERVAGKSDFDYYTWDHAQRAYDIEQEIMRSGRPWVGPVVELARPHSPPEWTSTTKWALRDEAGRVVGTFGVSRNVGEGQATKIQRDAALEALRESQRAMATLLGNLQGMAYRSRNDPQWTMEFVSQGCLALTGYAPEDLVGNRRLAYGDIIHPEARQASWDLVQAAVAARKPFQLTYRLVAADGTTKWVWEQGCGVFGPDQELLALEGFIADITDLKAAEQAVGEERNLLRTLIDAMPDHIYVKDRAGRTVLANTAQARALGLDSPDAIVGKTEAELGYAADVVQKLLGNDLAVMSGGRPINFEEHYTSPLGEPLWFSTTKAPLRDPAGEVIGVVGISRDISAQKRSEAQVDAALEALLENEERFRRIFEEGPLGMSFAAPDLHFMRANEAFRRMLGYTEDELTALTFTDVTHPDHVGQDAEAIRKVAQGELSAYRTEKRYVRKDGALVWGSLTLSAVRDRDGRLLYYLAMIEDITEHKRLEQQYLQVQKMDTVGRLAGGIAHDFNNLLTAIGGYASLARRGLRPGDAVGADIDQVIKASERAARLTRQLLAFSRRQIIQPQVIDLNRLILEIDKMLRRLIGENIEFVTLPVRHDPWRVRVDPGQIEQVLVNLVVNARDAMPTGGKLIIETANVTLDDEFARLHVGAVPGEHVLLAVTDSGVGMTDEVKAHLFEPFFTTKEKGKGTGLGLATVYGIVKQHQGTVWVHSEPGQGATFKIYLPRTEDATTAARPDETAELPRGNATVLVVEDEATVRGFAVRVLRDLGYTVLQADNGEEGLRMFEAHAAEIDLVVTDVVMPRMSGKELVDRIAVERPGLKALFVSGYTAEVGIAHEGILNEDVPFLQKPFSAALLARKVHAVLRG